MPRKLFILIVIVTLGIGGLFVTLTLKHDQILVSARYEMLACESCVHMQVEGSSNNSIIGETIIPVSDTVNIKQLIEQAVTTSSPLCLEGSLYYVNWNFFSINPSGKRFEVNRLLPNEHCQKNLNP